MAQNRNPDLDHKHGDPIEEKKEEKEEKKEAKNEVKETPADARIRKSASLKTSIASLISQAQKAHLKQVSLQVEENKRAHDEGRAARTITQEIYDPKVMYGYDSEEGGALKEWTKSMKLDEVEAQRAQGIIKIQQAMEQKKEADRASKVQELDEFKRQEAEAYRVSVQTEENKRTEARNAYEEAARLFTQSNETLNQLNQQWLAAQTKVSALLPPYNEAIKNKELELERIDKDYQQDMATFLEKNNDKDYKEELTRRGISSLEDLMAAYEAKKEKVAKPEIEEQFETANQRVAQIGETYHAQLQENRILENRASELDNAAASDLSDRLDQLKVNNQQKVWRFTTTNTWEQAEADRQNDVATQTRIAAFHAKMDKIQNFESELKAIQNSWMEEQPIELKAAQDKVDELRTLLADPDVQAIIPVARRTEMTAQLNKFTAVLDKQLNGLEAIAREKAYSTRAATLGKGVMSQQILYEKLSREKEAAHCDFLRMDVAPDEKTMAGIPLSADSQRAYVLVGARGTPQSLYFINKETKECHLVRDAESNEMRALNTEMEKGDQRSRFSPRSPRAARPLVTPPDAGIPLTRKQEARIREITKHARQADAMKGDSKLADWRVAGEIGWFKKTTNPAADWKELLPIAVTDLYSLENEKAKRREEEEKFDATTARDNALDRLSQVQNQDGVVNYDCNGAKFEISSTKNKDGNTEFFVFFKNVKLFSPADRADAMARMIMMCHSKDPQGVVELDCPDISRQSEYFIKRMLSELEHAVIAAEEAGKKGIHIDISFSDNASAYLNYDQKNLKLRERVATLHQEFEAFNKGMLNKESAATANAGAVTPLGAALASTPDPRAVGGEPVLQNALDNAFAGKTLPQKIEVLETEVKKLDAKVQQADTASASIKNELKTITDKLANPGADTAMLTEQYKALKRLEASQQGINEGLEKLTGVVGAGPMLPGGSGGIADNYKQRLSGAVMQNELNISHALLVQGENYINMKAAHDANPAQPPPPVLTAELKSAVDYLQQIKNVENVADKARNKYNEHQAGNTAKIAELKTEIERRDPAAVVAANAPPPRPAPVPPAGAAPVNPVPVVDPDAAPVRRMGGP